MSPRMTTPPHMMFSAPNLTSPTTVAFGKMTLSPASPGVRSYNPNTVLAFEIFYPYLLAGWIALVCSDVVWALAVENAMRIPWLTAVRNLPNIRNDNKDVKQSKT